MTMLSKKKSERKAAFVRATTQSRAPAISNPDVVRDVVKSMDDIEDETGEKISNLEAVVLDYSLGYTEKLLKINQFFKSNPLELAARCGEVIAQFSSVLAIWKYEDAMDIPLEKTNAGGEVERRGGEARSGVREVGADLVDEAGYYRGGSRGRVDDVAARREAV